MKHKRRTPEEAKAHNLRERLIAYYERRKAAAIAKDPDGHGGPVQKQIAAEIPCAIGTNRVADMTYSYTISKRYDVKVATSARYGIMKV